MRLIGIGNLEGFEDVVRPLSAGDVVCLESQAHKCLAAGWETLMALLDAATRKKIPKTQV